MCLIRHPCIWMGTAYTYKEGVVIGDMTYLLVSVLIFISWEYLDG